MMSARVAFFTLLALCCSAQTAFAQGTCLPTDTACLVRSAQLTVLATITGTNLNETGTAANSTNYNATVTLQCGYYSSDAAAVALLKPRLNSAVGTNVPVTVTGWGKPNPRCANNLGAEAIVGTTKVLFVYVTVGTDAASIVPTLAVFDICQGGVDPTTQVLTTIAQLQQQNPANVINLGTNCTLPALPSTTTARTTATSTVSPGGSATGGATASIRNSMAVVLLGSVAVLFAMFT
ncbi:hypothetical protein BJ742DRAFT_154770 [Cladochytrium replicatum]|nr:hypothetical protein BJ742DRAFT_154770 [Cladochytrium replicatum]